MKKYKFKRKDGTLKRYDFITEFKEGFAAVELKGKWGFIDRDGNEICPIKYSMSYYEYPKILDIRFFHEGYAVVRVEVTAEKNKYNVLRFGYINTKGEEVCPCTYVQAYDFLNGRALVIDEDSKWWIIDNTFNKITNRGYDEIRQFCCGHAIVRLGSYYGFINEAGQEMCEIKYMHMSDFGSHGFAQINIPNSEEGKVYFINTQGKAYYMHHSDNEMYPLT